MIKRSFIYLRPKLNSQAVNRVVFKYSTGQDENFIHLQILQLKLLFLFQINIFSGTHYMKNFNHLSPVKNQNINKNVLFSSKRYCNLEF